MGDQEHTAKNDFNSQNIHIISMSVFFFFPGLKKKKWGEDIRLNSGSIIPTRESSKVQ